MRLVHRPGICLARVYAFCARRVACVQPANVQLARVDLLCVQPALTYMQLAYVSVAESAGKRRAIALAAHLLSALVSGAFWTCTFTHALGAGVTAAFRTALELTGLGTAVAAGTLDHRHIGIRLLMMRVCPDAASTMRGSAHEIGACALGVGRRRQCAAQHCGHAFAQQARVCHAFQVLCDFAGRRAVKYAPVARWYKVYA